MGSWMFVFAFLASTSDAGVIASFSFVFSIFVKLGSCSLSGCFFEVEELGFGQGATLFFFYILDCPDAAFSAPMN